MNAEQTGAALEKAMGDVRDAFHGALPAQLEDVDRYVRTRLGMEGEVLAAFVRSVAAEADDPSSTTGALIFFFWGVQTALNLRGR